MRVLLFILHSEDADETQHARVCLFAGKRWPWPFHLSLAVLRACAQKASKWEQPLRPVRTSYTLPLFSPLVLATAPLPHIRPTA